MATASPSSRPSQAAEPIRTSSPPPPAVTALSEDDARLIEFLCGRDARCPRCRYNLRDLRTPVCPECEHRLMLTVGVQEVPVVPLIALLVPHIFSAMCAPLLLIPIILEPLQGGGPAPWFIIATDVFGWISGIAGVLVVWRRQRFLLLPLRRQWTFVAITWAVHVAAFVFLVAYLQTL